MVKADSVILLESDTNISTVLLQPKEKNKHVHNTQSPTVKKANSGTNDVRNSKETNGQNANATHKHECDVFRPQYIQPHGVEHFLVDVCDMFPQPPHFLYDPTGVIDPQGQYKNETRKKSDIRQQPIPPGGGSRLKKEQRTLS